MQKSVTSGTALALANLTSCDSAIERQPNTQRNFIKPFELDETTIADLQAGMRSGRYTARSITELYLGRINEIDKQGPSVNAVIELNPDALAIADELDKERASGHVRSPMHGIPVLIKDNIGTSDKMTTTAGSLALEGSIPVRDSYVAQKLRESGAIILGKTNLSEWANFRSSRSTSGWSGRGGQTLNPYALDRNPSGSSSGSGVAAAANLCAVSIGTETNGSIVGPSTYNGIVGIKPTVGLIGRTGIIPISYNQDTAGPMARTVSDAVVLLSCLTGIDPLDDMTRQSEGRSHKDYTAFLDPNGLRGKRIGIARNYAGFHNEVDSLFEEAVQAMKDSGAIIVDPANIESRGKLGDAGYEVMLYEFKDGINRYLTSLGNGVEVKSLADLIKFNEKNRAREMPWFEQEIFIKAQERGDLSTPEYLDALKRTQRLSREEGIDSTLRKHNLNAIVAPTGGPAHITDWINGDHFLGGSSSPAAQSGYPNITVPCGFIHGLPVGISFFSTAYSEPVLLSIAYAYEQTTKRRKAPGFLERVDLV